MANPILQQMMGNRTNSGINNISNIKNMMRGNPNTVINQMMNNNPQFRQFINENRGLSPDQIAQKYGVDMNQVNQLLR